MFTSDPKFEAHFALLQRPGGQPAAPLHGQAERSITSCCCFSKGTLYLQADAATNVVRAGDALGVTVQVGAAAAWCPAPARCCRCRCCWRGRCLGARPASFAPRGALAALHSWAERRWLEGGLQECLCSCSRVEGGREGDGGVSCVSCCSASTPLPPSPALAKPLAPAPPQVDNKSVVNVKQVRLLFEQCADISRAGINLRRTLAEQDFEGLAKGTSRLGPIAFQAMLPLEPGLQATSMGQVRAEMRRRRPWPSSQRQARPGRPLQPPRPPPNPPTPPPPPQITHMWYEVRVEAVSEGCCMDNAQITAPVALEDKLPLPPPQAPLALPPTWNPQARARCCCCLPACALLLPARPRCLAASAACSQQPGACLGVPECWAAEPARPVSRRPRRCRSSRSSSSPSTTTSRRRRCPTRTPSRARRRRRPSPAQRPVS
jgi:hypothetical protein